MAIRQFVDAYNYYIKTTTPEGNSNNIIKFETTKPAEGIAYAETDDGYYCYLEEYQGTNAGLSSVSITGHSLGGHLAALVSVATGASATIFNAPGYEYKQILGFSFVSADGTKNEIMAPVDAIMEKLLKVYMVSNNQIKHIYNDNGSEWIANYGRVWDNSIPIFCLQTNDSKHGIDEICTAYYAYETIKNNSTGSDCFFTEDSRTTFQEVFNNFYKAYYLSTNKPYNELDFSKYDKTLISEFKLWLEQEAENNTSIKVDSYNEDSWTSIEGTTDKDIIYLGGGGDGTNTGQGDDTVYGGDFFNKNPINYTKEISLGAGSDTYYGFNGSDTVYGGDEDSDEDVNRIYLGAGSDLYRGGNGIDIVDGGSGDKSGLVGVDSKYMTDCEDDLNIADLGGGDDIYTGGQGSDHIRGENGNDTLIGGDGQNDLDGGNDNDILIGGKDKDYLAGNTGIDYICARGGNNIINCGLDYDLDMIAINNDANGTDTLWDVRGNEIISCAGGFDLSSIHEDNGNLIIKGNNGNSIICKGVSFPRYNWGGNETDVGSSMPILYFPDGSVYQWQIGHYTDEGQWVEGHYRNSGTQWPSYVEEPSIETWQSLVNDSSGSNLTNGGQ